MLLKTVKAEEFVEVRNLDMTSYFGFLKIVIKIFSFETLLLNVF